MISLVQSMVSGLYIDPAATSVLLSSITSIAVALGATFIIIWRKMKKKVSKALHIDENKGKIVEDELVINEDETENSNVVAEGADAPASEEVKEESAEVATKEE